jgi:F-type H+-transporting ATPase subunit epsilon
MNLQIITPEKIVYDGDVDEITLKTTQGEISVLPHHVDLLTQVIPGELIIKINKDEKSLAITGGFLEVSNNTCKILADYAIHTHEIDMSKVEKAKEAAQKALEKAKESGSQRDFARAEAELRRNILMIDVASTRKRKI